VHHLEYGKFRLSHARPPFDAIAEDSDDDDDDDDDSDLLVPPFVRRHRTADPRHESMESLLAGGQSTVIALAQASTLPPHEIRPGTIFLESLHVRLQI
jgi:hypothetical protein